MSVIVFIIGALGGFYLKNVKDAVFRAKTWTVELAMVAVSYLLLLISCAQSNTWKIPLLFHRLFPQFIQQKVALWSLRHLKEPYFTLALFFGPFTFYLFVVGFLENIRRKPIQNAIDRLGLKTPTGTAPLVKEIYSGDNGQSNIQLKAPGFSIEELKSKKGNFESSLDAIVQDIRVSSFSRQVFEILIAKKEISSLVHFQEVTNHLTKPYSFLVGESLNGMMVANLCDIHHVIIAGATGGGKSVFFKQMLISLLKCSDSLQLYLIDLKRGVEMKAFSDLANVRIVKESLPAIKLLESIVEEMERRFLYLEAHSFTEIVPRRDRFDRIVIGIDEASVLFTIERHAQLGKENAERARELTDKIAKLGRAAAIHLIVATQKVVKETIDTRVQTNINARMVFRLNTVASSMTVLGNKKAAELPLIKGRAIWSVGSQDTIVQVPFLSPDEMNDELELLQTKFHPTNNKIFGPMLVEEGSEREEKHGFDLPQSSETKDKPEGI